METFDLLVIGSGPGGQRAAIQAAKLGKRAAVIERREIVGGVTAHTGTIPSKTLREAVYGGELEAFKLGDRTLRVDRADLERWVRSRRISTWRPK